MARLAKAQVAEWVQLVYVAQSLGKAWPAGGAADTSGPPGRLATMECPSGGVVHHMTCRES